MDLGSLVTGLISGFGAAYAFHRKIQVENVLQERTKWREEIRQITKRLIKNQTLKDNKCSSCQDCKSLLQAEIESDLAELQTRLNPADRFDLGLLIYARKAFDSDIKFSYELTEKGSPNNEAEKNRVFFLEKIAVLLKSDWERAKNDTTIFQHCFLEANRDYWEKQSYKKEEIEKIIQNKNGENKPSSDKDKNILKNVLNYLFEYWRSIKFKIKHFGDVMIFILLAFSLCCLFSKFIDGDYFSQNVSPVINNIISIFIK